LSLALAALLAATAADAPPTIRASELEKPTLALAERLFGVPDPGFAEVDVLWVPGVAQYSGVLVYFAQQPVPGGGAGLCRVEMRWVELDFVEPREQDSRLNVTETGRVHGYSLTSAAPGLKPVHPGGQESPCAHLPPVLQHNHWRVTHVQDGDREANDDEAAFGFMTLLAAKTAKDASPFVRRLDPRDVETMVLRPCPERSKHLCVVASVRDKDRGGGTVITVETAAAALPARRSGRPRIVRVSVGAYRDPVF
jgi:hypothetical protein